MGKVASIWAFAALLAAVGLLAVSGCGGDSATQTASAPDVSTAEGGEGQQDKGPSSSRSGAAAKPKKDTGAAKAASEDTPAGSGSGATAKQAPSITPPKGPREREATPKERAEATVVSMSLTSPALSPGPESVSPLPSAHTCQGKDTWPALEWSGVPAGTAELVLFAINIEPVDEALFFDWAVAGLDPSLEGLESGRLPKGAVVGKNSFGHDGYSVCPASSPETVIFALYALPSALGPNTGFDPAALRKQALEVSGNAGLLATSYSRG